MLLYISKFIVPVNFCIYFMCYTKSVFCFMLFVNFYCCFFCRFCYRFDFSPFDDYLLSTCSQDSTVSTLDCLLIICCKFFIISDILITNYVVLMYCSCLIVVANI